MSSFSIVVAQLNFTVGDIAGNAERIIYATKQAKEEFQSDLIVFPELALTGYPPEDLLFRDDFMGQTDREVDRIAAETYGITVVLGHPSRSSGFLYNAASIIFEGRILGTYHKRKLPNYSVFDEKRYFTSGGTPMVARVGDFRIAITICEDIWHEGPVEDSAAEGADILININASPFHIDKARERETEVVCEKARRNHIPIIYLNLVGGQDELVFDGGSFVVDDVGRVTQRGHFFKEELVRVELNREGNPIPQSVSNIPQLEESVYEALVIGVRDYVVKNRFENVIIGLSGGIDSALTLAIAVDSLGCDSVKAILMPSRYTREMSITDAIAQAEMLGVEYSIFDIEPLYELFLSQLNSVGSEGSSSTMEENLQARIRGVILMALSNKTGAMVLSTGNKSEMAVGYSTLYGDMVGGFAAIKDVPKTLVYKLARYRNAISSAIPKRVIDRAPSAELSLNQEDIDTLPPYNTLDFILQAFIEDDQSIDSIVSAGPDRDLVNDVVKRVKANEYKRRQAAPGVRISQRAFGRDRRYPITSGFD
ncbi:MAG: NAD+ synthase [Acidiferrobacteraceae bacterium]|nr:NAD+ synthase [Acidiferrobacteraceae bacterium]